MTPHVKNKDHVPNSDRHHLTTVVGWDVNCRIKFSIVETLPVGSQGWLATESQDPLTNSMLTITHDSNQARRLPETTGFFPATTVGCL